MELCVITGDGVFAATVGIGQGRFVVEGVVAEFDPVEIRFGAIVGVVVAGRDEGIVDGLCVGEA